MKEFKVNEYITVKLFEEDYTSIFVNGEYFDLCCRYLLLEVPLDKTQLYNDVLSIDKVAERLGWSEDFQEGIVEYNISPEEEFWGQCSNLQAWAENNYDTCLLHRTIAFPLLRRLADIGDVVAKRVFKEEIAKRIETGYITVIEYLINEHYLNIFNKEELNNIFQKFDFNKILSEPTEKALPLLRQLAALGFPSVEKVFKEEITKIIGSGNLIVINYLRLEGFLDYLNEGEFAKLLSEPNSRLRANLMSALKNEDSSDRIVFPLLDYLNEEELETIFSDLNSKLANKKELDLNSCKLTIFPKYIKHFKSLQTLKLYSNRLTALPESIGNLKSLQTLNLSSNRLTALPESIGNLKSLQTLYLGSNKLLTLPESIGNLSSLKYLGLIENQIKRLPESIGNLKSIIKLTLWYNQLTTLPESIGNLKSLQELGLNYNQLMTLPESIGDLSSLQELRIYHNKLTTLPESIGNIKSLQVLDVSMNQLTSLPNSIGNLKSLRFLKYDGNKMVSKYYNI